MSKLWLNIGCFLTGWNSDILSGCTEASFKQLKKYTSAILILMILWALIGYSFVDRYTNLNTFGCIISAIIFVIIVIQIEKQIILNVGKISWMGFFRLTIALIMALIGSAILDQIIFKDDVQHKMIQIVDRKVNHQLPNRVQLIDNKLFEINQQIDSIDSLNLALYNEVAQNPTIPTISTSYTETRPENGDTTGKKIISTTVHKTPIPNPKITQINSNNLRLASLRSQDSLYVVNKLNAANDLRTELTNSLGFLEELGAIIEILKESKIAFAFYIVLFLFLMSLELFVLVSKATSHISDYEMIVQHQLDQKKKTLQNLIKEK